MKYILLLLFVLIVPESSFAGLWDALVEVENERIAEEARDRYLYGVPEESMWDVVFNVIKISLSIIFLLSIVLGVIWFVIQIFSSPSHDHELGVYKLTTYGGVCFKGEDYQLKNKETLISVEEFKDAFDGKVRKGRKNRFAFFDKCDTHILDEISLTQDIFKEL